MKIRHGFVSNSSTSSFVIYGAVVPAAKAAEIENLSNSSNWPDMFIDVFTDEYDMYIGSSLETLYENLTGREIREKTEAAVKKLLGPDVKCEVIARAWYNG